MMDERMKKAEALISDQAFFKAALNAESETDVQKLFADNGVDFTIEEIGALRETMIAAFDGRVSEEQLQKAVSGELSEEELMEAAGGFSPETNVKIFLGSLMGLTIAALATYKGCEAAEIDLGQEIKNGYNTVKDGVVTGYNAVKDGVVSGYGWVKDNITRW
ncbi:MAG: hypothetical protein IKN55_11175 [Oscillospiraceae bacterium]|nr:hypothetical protein [Oscillospiraceae bacterium]